tara:strand:+ start:15908 stop:16993 length:1086 start_codon:yes stop_codon:yes gene_type:complete
MQEKKKVFFILPNLMAGGAERVISFIAQNLDVTKFEPTLYIIGNEKDKAFETKKVRTVFLNKSRVLIAIPLIFKLIKKNKPQIVISAIGHLNTIMGLISIFFPRIKFIGREVNVISVLQNYDVNKSKLEFPLLTTLSYRLLDKIICQSNDMKADLLLNFKINDEKLIVINNPITSNFILKQKINRTNKQKFELITVGRLAKQKGHLRLLEIIKKINLPIHYTIIGSGPEEDTIFSEIKRLKLEDVVTHIPYSNEIPKYLSKSDLFLQGSYVEGFPNALIESCAVGTPVIAFNAKGGIDEIIEDGVNGYIAYNTEDFINKTNLILNSLDKWSPKIVSESVYKKYDSHIIIKNYEELLLKVTE